MTCLVRRGMRAVLQACVLAILFGAAAPAGAETRILPRQAYAAELDGLKVAFLARDLATGTDHVLEGGEMDARTTPWSSFKIPNLLIALETGVAPSLDAWREWDPARRPPAEYWPEAWRQGQTLGQAFARSTVWYFQDLARAIGAPAYGEILSRWGYGNAAGSGTRDDFWNGDSLRISVREQVRFLERLMRDELQVTAASIGALDTASLAGRWPGVTLHGKTGSGPDDPRDLDGAFSGWYVGYLRRDGQAPVVFALHVAAPSFRALRDFRRAFSIRLLEDAGLAPRGAFRSS